MLTKVKTSLSSLIGMVPKRQFDGLDEEIVEVSSGWFTGEK